jgi:hypothetical protein
MFWALFSPTVLKWYEPYDSVLDQSTVFLTEHGIKTVAYRSLQWSNYRWMESCEVRPDAASPQQYTLTFALNRDRGLMLVDQVRKVVVPPGLDLEAVCGLLAQAGVRVIRFDSGPAKGSVTVS